MPLSFLFVCYGVHHSTKVLESKDMKGKKEKKSWVVLILQLARDWSFLRKSLDFE